MNLTNPHMTIRREDRRDVQRKPARGIDKTRAAAKKIAAGINLGRVLREGELGKMTDKEIIDGYHQEAIEAMHYLAHLILDDGERRLLEIPDEELHVLAVAAETAGRGVKNYLQLKALFD